MSDKPDPTADDDPDYCPSCFSEYGTEDTCTTCMMHREGHI
jgi:hypothetical protein